MAWNSFSPVTEKQVLPPFFRHGNPLRKYQHQGRWQTFPASVQALRICGVPTISAASARTVYCLRMSGCSPSEAQEELLAAKFERIVVMLDGDEPGQKAAAECLARLGRRMWVRAAVVP